MTDADRTDPAPAPDVDRPERLGDYRIGDEIGRGTMGRVFVAHHVSRGDEVAIKTLALSREFDGFALREAHERFVREVQAAARLDHPDIVRVLDSGQDQGLAYLVMERLHGHDLTRHVQETSLLSVTQAVAVAARIAEALAHAHAQGVIHRDIKPANVMVDAERDQVRVMDFGIARLNDANRTRTGLVLGSPFYMSPEQLAGHGLDGRSDLYALGVLLFQLLTARLPFNGPTVGHLIHAIAHDTPVDVRAMRPGLPEPLANIVTILLQKRPELRYRDGHQVAVDLRWVADRLQPLSGADGAVVLSPEPGGLRAQSKP
ncbi:MAG: serine/threonine-protein kinase [Leptothrix sp. (in: b-proteobacteria)]